MMDRTVTFTGQYSRKICPLSWFLVLVGKKTTLGDKFGEKTASLTRILTCGNIPKDAFKNYSKIWSKLPFFGKGLMLSLYCNTYLYTTLFFVNFGINFEHVPKGKTTFKTNTTFCESCFCFKTRNATRTA